MRPHLSASVSASVNTDDTQPCTHQFANCSADEAVACLWLDCDGEEREYHRLPPGHATAQSEMDGRTPPMQSARSHSEWFVYSLSLPLSRAYTHQPCTTALTPVGPRDVHCPRLFPWEMRASRFPDRSPPHAPPSMQTIGRCTTHARVSLCMHAGTYTTHAWRFKGAKGRHIGDYCGERPSPALHAALPRSIDPPPLSSAHASCSCAAWAAVQPNFPESIDLPTTLIPASLPLRRQRSGCRTA